MSTAPTTYVDVWVDPVCPWTWLATRWLLAVERVRPVTARFHLMSLSVVNEDRDDVSDFYREGVARWWGPPRVVAAAAAKLGDDVIRPLYEALGTRIHRRDEAYGPALYEAALAEAGVPADLVPSLVAAADDPAWSDDLRTRTTTASLQPGDEVLGVPTIHLPGPDGKPVAHHGPVVNPAPTGEDAGRLWDGLLTVASVPGFGEIKRTRAGDPLID